MIKRICSICGTEMVKKYDNGLKYFCESCNSFTEYTEKNFSAYCPDCGSSLENCSACGCNTYFCDKCGEIKSKKKILWK